MQERSSIEKLVTDTIGSFDGAKRAAPKPFLLTRVMASINNRPFSQNGWTRLAAFISQPGIAIAGLLLVLLLNITIFLTNNNNSDPSNFVQNNSYAKDEFATTVVSFYDIENPEQ
ncbi:MAG: hypothetical protein ABIN36_06365 [Ferruginibacter sp.]